MYICGLIQDQSDSRSLAIMIVEQKGMTVLR